MDIDLKHVTLSASWNRGRVMAALVLGALLSSCGVPAAEEASIAEPAPSQPESQEGTETIDAAASEELFALLDAEPNPLNVALVLEEASASELEIGPEGGILEAISGDGAVYRLFIPKGALVRLTTIRMIPVKSAGGLPFSGGVVAGVELEPSGLSLLVPATLSLEIPEDLPLEESWGVSTLAAGNQAALYPFSHNASSAEMIIGGFSGKIISQGGIEDAKALARRPVTATGRRVVSEVALILKEAALAQHEDPENWISDPYLAEIQRLASQWEEQIVKGLRERALADDIEFLRFGYELDRMLELEGIIQSELEEGLWSGQEILQLWETPAEKAIERALERCKTEHRIGEIDWIGELVGRTQLLGGEGGGIGIIEARRACGVFRLSFQSTISQQGSSSVTSNELVLFVGGEIPEIFPDLFIFQDDELPDEPAFGAIVYLEARGTSVLRGADGSACTAKTAGGIDSTMRARLGDFPIRPQRFGPWSVPEIYGPIQPPEDPQEGLTNILFDPGEPRERVTGECMGTTTSTEGDTWDLLFWANHFDTILDPPTWEALLGMGESPSEDFPEDSGFVFNLSDFEGGRRYALQSIEECYQATGSDGGSGETCERTFFILYHEPPQTAATSD